MQDASRGVAVSVLVVLCCLSAAGPAVGAVDERGSPALAGQGVAAQTQAPPAFQSAVDPDVVVLRAAVDEDGTAAWTAEFRVRLDDENATAAFESVQADVRENASSFTSQFATGMRRTVASAENSTGREMALSNVTVTATRERLPQEYGVLTYRFTWTNFAATDGDRLRVGDSLSGLFLDRESSLVLSWPAGYERQSTTPEPDETGNGSVTWRGPADFGPNEPRVVAAPASGGLPTTALAGLLVVLVAAVAHSIGADVVVSGLAQDAKARLPVVDELGIDTVNVEETPIEDVADERTDGIGFDVVFDTTGHRSGVETAADVVRKGGQVVVVGLPGDPSEIFMTPLVRGEVDLETSYGSNWTDFERALRLMEQDAIDPATIMDASYSTADPTAAFEDFLDSVVVKPVFTFDDG